MTGPETRTAVNRNSTKSIEHLQHHAEVQMWHHAMWMCCLDNEKPSYKHVRNTLTLT